jgi:cytochrome c553
VTVTRAGADDFFNIPNWRPDMYPALPKIVQYGNKDAQVRACGSCHLRPAPSRRVGLRGGLTQRYFMQQMADWKSGDRKFGRHHDRDGPR